MTRNEGGAHIENLQHTNPIRKLKALIKAANICMFTTSLSQQPLNTRPMSTQETDDDGNIWFFSGSDTQKNHEISIDPQVQLFYSNIGGSEFLTVYGRAEIINDRSKINELWTPIVGAWFKDGKQDPTVTLIKVIPEHVYYWDLRSNKMVALLKAASEMIANTSMNEGIDGTLAL